MGGKEPSGNLCGDRSNEVSLFHKTTKKVVRYANVKIFATFPSIFQSKYFKVPANLSSVWSIVIFPSDIFSRHVANETSQNFKRIKQKAVELKKMTFAYHTTCYFFHSEFARSPCLFLKIFPNSLIRIAAAR